MNRTMLTILAICLAVGVLAALTYTLNDWPQDIEEVEIYNVEGLPHLSAGQALRVVVWNLQFGASTKHHFFYDGGDAVHVPRDDVVQTVARIGDMLKSFNADLILLQEVDRGSARTSNIDQALSYAWALPEFGWAGTRYHRSRYVPHPLRHPMGRVDMHLVVYSRFAMQRGQRHQLPLLNEPWFRRAFNLKRALLGVELPVIDGASLRLGNTHLSAFDPAGDVVEAQGEALMRWAHETPRWLLGGDFNVLPPGDTPGRLPPGTTGGLRTASGSLATLLRESETATAWDDVLNPTAYTYAPFGAEAPDRKIDYLLAGPDLQVLDWRVAREAFGLSDHLPIVATVKLK